MTSDRVIGKNGNLPWRIPEDLKNFKQITLHHPVIMGRTTFESLNMPNGLPKRDNIVITRNPDLLTGNATIVANHGVKESVVTVGHYPKYVGSLTEAIDIAKDIDNEVFIIGGASIYKQAIEANIVDCMYISYVKDSYEGDAYFPEFDLSRWKEETVVVFDEFVFLKIIK